MPDHFRFVVTYRREQRSKAQAPDTWRGWIELAYPMPDEREETDRRAFVKLCTVGDLLAEMVKDAGGPDAG